MPGIARGPAMHSACWPRAQRLSVGGQKWSWFVRPDHVNEVYTNASRVRSLPGP